MSDILFKDGDEFELLKDILDSIERGSSSSGRLGTNSSTLQQHSPAQDIDLEQFDLLTLHARNLNSNGQQQQQQQQQQTVYGGPPAVAMPIQIPMRSPLPSPLSHHLGQSPLAPGPCATPSSVAPPGPITLLPSVPPSTIACGVGAAERPRLCHVCHSPAGKHNYYGGQVCESCRAFFRRTVQSESQGSTAECKLSGQCPIDSKSRKSCSVCRYKKCIQAGMNPNWLMTDKERKMKRGRQKLNLVPSQDVLETPLKMPFTMEEVLRLKEMYDDLKVIGYDALCDVFSRDPRTPNKIFEMIRNGSTNTDPLLLKEIESHERERFMGIAFRVEDIDQVPRQDRHKLVRHNFPIYFATLISLYFGEHDFDALYAEYREYIRNYKLNESGMSHVLDLFDNLTRNGKKLRLKYEQLYNSPWAPNTEIEDRHRKLCGDIQRWPRHKENDPFDDILILLTLLNIIFSTNGLELASGKQIEKIQNYYAMMLYRYLKTYSPENSPAKFAQGLMLPAIARECYDLHCKMLPI